MPGQDFTSEQGELNRPGETDPAGFIIAPGGDEDLAWAVYGIGGFDQVRPSEFSIDINGVIAPGADEDLPFAFWIGISNFSTFAWEWHGPYSEPASLVLNSELVNERYVSVTNSFFYAVVVDSSGVEPTAGNPDGLAAVEVAAATAVAMDALSPDYHNTVPHYPLDYLTLLGGKGGSDLDPDLQYAHVAWTHLADSASPSNEAASYEVRRYRQGGSTSLTLLGTVPAPTEKFTDPTDSIKSAGKPVPGETYEYYVRAISDFGATPFVFRTSAAIPMLPPANLTASFGEFDDRVELKWKRPEGAVQFYIYRDTSASPYAVTDNKDKWNDETLTDQAVHAYWVRGVNMYGHEGSISELVQGKLNSPPVAKIRVGAGQTSGNPPLTVDFDGSESYDPDDLTAENGIVKYEWDVDGDGSYDHSSGSPTYQFIYDASYTDVTAVLRVTDSTGKKATDSIQIHVSQP